MNLSPTENLIGGLIATLLFVGIFYVIFYVVGNSMATGLIAEQSFLQNKNCHRNDGLFQEEYYLCREGDYLVRYEGIWINNSYEIKRVK